LLGHVLSLRAGMDYETLVRRRITEPLGMKDTAITLSPDMAARLAVGHDANLKAVKNWDLPTLAGAGALRSTANDLLTFLGAELELTNAPLRASMDKQLSVRRPTDATMPNMTIALGWLVLSDPKGTVIWHNGGTGGYRTYMGFNAATRTGVVVLANASAGVTPDDIGLYLLNGTPLANIQPPKLHTEIALDLTAKRAFVGQYQLAPSVVMSITLEGEQLFGQLTNQQKFPIFPESPTQVFFKVVEAQISFDVGADGKASIATLHQNGRDIPATRVN
jgi:CubicO group peptidase (beta-lactamase class C family)